MIYIHLILLLIDLEDSRHLLILIGWLLARDALLSSYTVGHIHGWWIIDWKLRCLFLRWIRLWKAASWLADQHMDEAYQVVNYDDNNSNSYRKTYGTTYYVITIFILFISFQLSISIPYWIVKYYNILFSCCVVFYFCRMYNVIMLCRDDWL